MTSIRRCVEGGLGVTICPEISVREELSKGRLIRLDWEEQDMDTNVIMIWHNEKWCSPLLSRFLELSKELIR